MEILWQAITRGEIKTVKNILKNEQGKSFLDQRNKHGFTALHLASFLGNLSIVKILLRYGANPNVNDRGFNRWTCCHWAAFKNHFQVLVVLLQSGGSIEGDITGKTPLDLISEQVFLSPKKKQFHEELNLFTWGSGMNYQLGHGTANTQTTPKKVLGLNNVVQASASKYHTIAVTKDGTVWTWGVGTGGRLGHGVEEIEIFPRQITSLSEEHIVMVSAGPSFSAVVTREGDIYTFGEFPGHESLLPKSVGGALTEKIVTFISCGRSHIACTTNKGELYTYGTGDRGQLGHGVFNDQKSPRSVASLSDYQIIQVAAGNQQTMALTSRGQAFIFGFGVSEPEKVKIDKSCVSKKISHISCGGNRNIYIISNGEVFTWLERETPQKINVKAKIIKSSVEGDTSVMLADSGTLFQWSATDNRCDQLYLTDVKDVCISKYHMAAIVTSRCLKRISSSKSAFSKRFVNFVGMKEFSDVVFVLEKTHRIYAHRILLACRSNYFRSLFLTEEGEKKEIHLESTKASVFKIFLNYIYTDELDLNEKTDELLFLAEKYKMNHLKKRIINKQTQHTSRLKDDLAWALQTEAKFLADAFIQTEELTQGSANLIPVHKIFLATSDCSFFQAMFASNWKESFSSTIKVGNISAKVMQQVVSFLYLEEISGKINEQLAADLLIASNQLFIESLKQESIQMLISNINLTNIAIFLELSELCQAPDLRLFCFDFILKNLPACIEAKILTTNLVGEIDSVIQESLNKASSKPKLEDTNETLIDTEIQESILYYQQKNTKKIEIPTQQNPLPTLEKKENPPVSPSEPIPIIESSINNKRSSWQSIQMSPTKSLLEIQYEQNQSLLSKEISPKSVLQSIKILSPTKLELQVTNQKKTPEKSKTKPQWDFNSGNSPRQSFMEILHEEQELQKKKKEKTPIQSMQSIFAEEQRNKMLEEEEALFREMEARAIEESIRMEEERIARLKAEEERVLKSIQTEKQKQTKNSKAAQKIVWKKKN